MSVLPYPLDRLSSYLRTHTGKLVNEWTAQLVSAGAPWESIPGDERTRACSSLLRAAIMGLGPRSRGALRDAADTFARDAIAAGLRPPEVQRALQLLRRSCWDSVRSEYVGEPLAQLDAYERLMGVLDTLYLDCADACNRAMYATSQQQLHDMEEELRTLRVTVGKDMQTRLYNRGYFDDRLSHEVRRARRQQSPLAVVRFSIDGYEQISREHGRATGNSVVCAVGDLMLRLLRAEDCPARVDSGDFGLLLPEATIEDAAVPSERLRLAAMDLHFKEAMRVSLSIGITAFVPGDTEWVLGQRVLEALSASKTRGGNTLTLLPDAA